MSALLQYVALNFEFEFEETLFYLNLVTLPDTHTHTHTHIHTQEVQTQLGHKQGINSFLIRPVQRITKYKLLLSDLHKTAKKAQLDTPILEKALSLMEEIPKRANDAMTLSMICGYDGNIHSYGQLIAHVSGGQGRRS